MINLILHPTADDQHLSCGFAAVYSGIAESFPELPTPAVPDQCLTRGPECLHGDHIDIFGLPERVYSQVVDRSIIVASALGPPNLPPSQKNVSEQSLASG